MIADSKPELRELLRTITQRMRLLYAGGLPANLGPASPPDDNGVLGPELPSQQVAFVLGLGSSLFDDRFGLAPLRPAGLTRDDDLPERQPRTRPSAAAT